METNPLVLTESKHGIVEEKRLSDIIRGLPVEKRYSSTHIINGFKCTIYWNNGYYCGYVDDKESILIEEPDVHGGLTTDLGFDCAHYDDINLKYVLDPCNEGFKKPTFKTKEYVLGELHNLTMALKAPL